MKRVFLIFCIFCVITAMAFGQNMLGNPGFEDIADDSSWISYAQTGASIDTMSDGNANSGDYWMKITSTEGGMYLLYQNTFPASTGQVYELSAFFKDLSPAELGASYAALKISAKNANGATFHFTEEYQDGVTSSWQQFTSTMTMPEGTAYIQAVIVVHAADGAPEAVYGIDDVCLEFIGYATDTNILANPGFENGDSDEDGIPDGWLGYPQTGASMEIMNDGTANTGAYWAKCTSTQGGFYLLYQNTFPVEPGNTYEFSSYIKDVSPADPGAVYAALKISAKNSSGGTFKAWEEYQDGVTSEWQEFSNIKTMPEGTAYIQVVIVVHGADDALESSYGFDDVGLKLIYEKPEIPTELNWFANPGFEEGDSDENGIPDGWLGGGQTNGSILTVNDPYESYSGEYYSKVTSINGDYYLLYYKTIPANPGEVWRLSSFIKDVSESDPGGNFCALKISAKNSSGGTFEAIQEFQEVTTYWKQFTAEYIMPENTAYLQAVFVVNGSDYTAEASYAFDDVRLEIVHELYEDNPGFEKDEDGNSLPDGWSLWNQTEYHVDSLAHYGDAWIEARIDSGNGYSLIYLPTIPTSPGDVWSWRSFIKRTVADSVKDCVYLKMAAKNSNGSTFQNFEIRQTGVTQDWEDYSTTQVMPVGTAYMQPSLVVKKSSSDNLDADLKVAYGFDDIRLVYLGVNDLDAPETPTTLSADESDDYYNVITWTDDAAEFGETYALYASTQAFTSVNDDGVELLLDNIEKGTQAFTHYLYCPYEDDDITFYYGLTVTDSANNVSEPGVTSAITNTAKGVPAIATNIPENFAVDGDISEWDSSGVKAFVLAPSVNHIGVGEFDDDSDLTFTGYFGVDEDNLYVSIKVTDDAYCYDSEASYYKNDVVFLYLGLYDFEGTHMSTERGEEPDYRFNLLSNYLRNVNAGTGNDTLYQNGDDNYKFIVGESSDYVVEAKIPFDDILVGDQAGDTRFVPELGMKIAMDIEICDSDELGSREGLLAYSLNNDDTSWKGPQYWANTWIDDSTFAVGTDDEDILAYEYKLEQNYPNPFNPTTKICYSLAKTTEVKIYVYNMLGQEVNVFKQGVQKAGQYNVIFNAHNFASGVYIYKIKAGNYIDSRKMLLIK